MPPRMRTLAVALLALSLVLPFAAAAEVPDAITLDDAGTATDFKCRPDIEYYCKLAVCIVFGPWPCVII